MEFFGDLTIVVDQVIELDVIWLGQFDGELTVGGEGGGRDGVG